MSFFKDERSEEEEERAINGKMMANVVKRVEVRVGED